MSLCLVKNLPRGTYRRAGIIPYRYDGEMPIFAFGRDRKHRTIGSFSGSIRNGETIVQAAIREFGEETLNVFGVPKLESIMDCLVCYDDKQILIFVHMVWQDDNIISRFNTKMTSNSEMSELIYLDYAELRNVIAGFEKRNRMYYKVARLISSTLINNGDFLSN